MSSKKIKHAATAKREDVIYEDENGIGTKWQMVVPVRSVKNALAELTRKRNTIIEGVRTDARAKVRELLEGEGLDREPTAQEVIGAMVFSDEQEDELLRIACDRLSTLTETVTEGQSPMGDVLFDAWAAGDVVDEWITALTDDVEAAVGKTSAS